MHSQSENLEKHNSPEKSEGREIRFEGFFSSLSTKTVRYSPELVRGAQNWKGEEGFFGHLHHVHSHPQKAKASFFLVLVPSAHRNQLTHVSAHLGMHHQKKRKNKSQKTRHHTPPNTPRSEFRRYKTEIQVNNIKLLKAS